MSLASSIRRRTRAIGTATATVLLAATLTPVGQAATMIGVDFYGNAGLNHVLAPSDSAGVVPQTNWTGERFDGSLSGPLKSNAGVSTSVSITAESGAAGVVSIPSPTTNNERLMFDGATGNKNTTTPVSMTLGGLNATFPNGYYVIVYSWTTSANRQHVTLGATTYYMQNAASFGGFVQATSTSSGSPTAGANYVQFGSDASPLTGNTFTVNIVADSSSYRAPINGFQIVGAAPPRSTGTVVVIR